jgi:hypothetical protein
MMQKSIVLLVIIAVFFSCQKKETEPVTAKPVEETIQTSDLYSKVYYISTELSTESCTVQNPGCDCCDGAISFLENGTFVSEFYCLPNQTYQTGTFKIENKKLVLEYSNKEAVYGPANEDYSEEEESTWRLDSIKGGISKLDIIRCKKQYIFKDGSDYYAEDKKASFAKSVKGYKSSGVWKLLDVKE